MMYPENNPIRYYYEPGDTIPYPSRNMAVLGYIIWDRYGPTVIDRFFLTAKMHDGIVFGRGEQIVQTIINNLNDEFISYDVDLQDYIEYAQTEKTILASKESFEDSCDI